MLMHVELVLYVLFAMDLNKLYLNLNLTNEVNSSDDLEKKA